MGSRPVCKEEERAEARSGRDGAPTWCLAAASGPPQARPGKSSPVEARTLSQCWPLGRGSWSHPALAIQPPQEASCCSLDPCCVLTPALSEPPT